MIPVNAGTCQFLGQRYGPRTTNVSILIKFYTLNKSRVVNSMATIVFCDCQIWDFSILAPVIFYAIFLNKSCKNFNLVKIFTLHNSKTLGAILTIVFLWFLMLVNFDLCQYWYLPCFRSQIWMNKGKCFSFDET